MRRHVGPDSIGDWCKTLSRGYFVDVQDDRDNLPSK